MPGATGERKMMLREKGNWLSWMSISVEQENQSVRLKGWGL